MNEIKIFEKAEFGQVRTVMVEDTPWFVGKDVAKVLGYHNHRKALIDHVDADEKRQGVLIRDSIGRTQMPVMINESGVYSLIMGSKLPQARQFRRWVTSEVLPQIRKTGGYIPLSANDDANDILEKALKIAEANLKKYATQKAIN